MARPIAVALAVVIALSALMVAPHLGDARGASIHASPHPAFLSILAVNGNGATSPFHSGLGSGTIYFIAGGGVLNATGNVTITDQNASRDGVPTPAKVFEIVFRGGTTNDSRGTANYYQIPLNLNYTGEWNITLNTSGTSVTSTFLVEAFAVYFTTDRSGYLPGHSGTIYWLVERDANGAPFTDYTSLQIAGSYRNNTSVVSALSFPSHTLTVAANGTIPFTVPADAQTGYSVNIVMWANQTKVGTKTNWSSSHTYDPQVDAINNLNLAFINCGVCGTFRTGTPVEVSIDVQLTGSGIADGLLATVTFYSGTQAVTAPSGTPTSLTTNGSGRAALVFVPMQPAFSTTHNNSVSVTLTDPKDPGVKVTNFIDFDLTNVSASARVQVTLNQATYYSGDTVTATWVVGGINATAPVGWKISEVYAEGYSNGRYSLFEYGTVNTTATTGTFTFQVPADFQGELYVYAVIANATQETENGVAAVILPPTIFVNPSEAIYQAGDSISVSVTTEGQAFSTATLYESTVDSSGETLSSGVVSGSTFSIIVPKIAAPGGILFTVIAQTSAGGVIASASAESTLESGYRLTASIQTSSGYSDGSYQPGQTLTVQYSFTSLGTTPLPPEITVRIVPGATLLDLDIGDLYQFPGSATRTSYSDSGTMTFTLPGDLPNGYTSVLVFAYPTNAAGTGCSDPYSECGAASQLTVNVQGSPSALNYEVGAGSGLTVAWLILLVLIIILTIVGTLWIRRRITHSGASKWSEPPKTFTSTPPAGDTAGSTDTGGSGSPPLPPPSGGI